MVSRYNLSAKDIERFHTLVSRVGEHWMFTGTVDKDGYGRFRFGSRADGTRRLALAHRVAFFIAYGWLSPVVRHKCDIPGCMRPAHLLGGTQLDNIADMDERRRRRSKLVAQDVLDIRRQLAAGRSQRSIAAMYGVTQTAVSRIHCNKLWKGVR